MKNLIKKAIIETSKALSSVLLIQDELIDTVFPHMNQDQINILLSEYDKQLESQIGRKPTILEMKIARKITTDNTDDELSRIYDYSVK